MGQDQVSSSFQCSANYNTPSFSPSSARKSYRHVVKRASILQGWKTCTSASRANLQGQLQAIGITKNPRTIAWASNKLQVNLQALRIRELVLWSFPDRRLELLKQYFRGKNRNIISANRCSWRQLNFFFFFLRIHPQANTHCGNFLVQQLSLATS